jgi:uridine nucleosidase
MDCGMENCNGGISNGDVLGKHEKLIIDTDPGIGELLLPLF